MSQHYFSTHHQGRMVTITLGWACPLQGYFCTVERNDAEGDEDAYVYSILYDDALDSRTGLAESLDYFDALLMARRMTVPRGADRGGRARRSAQRRQSPCLVRPEWRGQDV